MQLLIYIGTFCFDFFFSNLVILNLVVFVWRIIWDTQDIYLKSNVCLNSMISITSSLIILVLVKIKQMKNAKHFSLMNNEENADPYYIKNQKYSPQLKIFILIFSFANINLWRGFWNFTLFYTNESMMGILMIGIISLLALIAMNRVCALVSVPYIYAKDTCNTAYQIDPDTIKPNVCLKIEQELKVFIFSSKSMLFKKNVHKIITNALFFNVDKTNKVVVFYSLFTGIFGRYFYY